jgi:hypothetical protein
MAEALEARRLLSGVWTGADIAANRDLPIAASHTVRPRAVPIGMASPFTDTQVTLPTPIDTFGPMVAVDGTIIIGHAIESPDQAVHPAMFYDPATGQFSIVHLPRTLGTAATTVGDKAIFAGGDGGHQSNSVAHVSDAVDIYDAANGTWSSATLSDRRFDMNAVTIGSQAIFFGGWGSGSESGVYDPGDAVDIYDNTSGQWTHAQLSAARNGPWAVVGTKIVFGPGRTHLFPGKPDLVNVTDVYDTATEQWSVAPPSPMKRAPLAGAVVGNTAAFIDENRAYFYDLTSGQWSMRRLSKRGSGEGLVATADGSGIAWRSGGTTIDVFDPARRPFPLLRPTPHIQYSDRVAELDGRAVFLTISARYTDDSLHTHYFLDAYDSPSGQWSSARVTTGAAAYPTDHVVGNQLIIAGQSQGLQAPTMDLFTEAMVAGPARPSPADGATVRASHPDPFTWSPVPGATGYDVYLDDRLTQTGPDAQLDPTLLLFLSPGWHTWSVVARLPESTTLTGPTWRFRLGAGG